MEILNNYINDIYNFVKKKKQEGTPVYEYQMLESVETSKQAGIVFKSDTFLELGGPEAGSCAFSLFSETSKMIKDGKITLIGKGVKKSPNAYPFGQIIIAKGALDRKMMVDFSRCHHLDPNIDGYMLKSSVRNVWGRVSNDAGKRGFCFAELGSAIIKTVKQKFPQLKATEVLFCTYSKEDIKKLSVISQNVQAQYQSVKEDIWSAKGINIYDCAFHGNCDSCFNKNACDEIRDIVKLRRTRTSI